MRDINEYRRDRYNRNKEEINRKRRLRKYTSIGYVTSTKSNIHYFSFDNPCGHPCLECPEYDCIVDDIVNRRKRCS